jgi:outer membrane protein insertion porin family
MPKFHARTRAIITLILLPVYSAVALEGPIIRSVSVTGTKMPVELETQVGKAYDSQTIETDVRNLWKIGRFSDVKVESTDTSDGRSVLFHVVEEKQFRLHEIHIEPSIFGLKPSLQPGAAISPLLAHRIAVQARKELVGRGYTDASVDADLVPYSGDEVDVRLTIHATDRPVRVKEVRFVGQPGLSEKELRGALQSLRIRRILPKVPGVTQGFRMFPRYSESAVDSDLARLHSLYVSKGYFDAEVRRDNSHIDNKGASLDLFVDSGPRYNVQQWTVAGNGISTVTADPTDGVFNARDVCACLFDARRAAEREGILDFNARMRIQPIASEEGRAATVAVDVDRGPAYHVGRIYITGNHSFSDAFVRKNFVLNESDLLNERLLRKSIQRLNGTMMFDPLTMNDVAIRTNAKTGWADVSVRLKEKKRGSWNLSGPVGPASFAGPLQGSIMSRLPSWGRGILELSTYTASFSMVAFATPAFLGIATTQTLYPILALQRPFTPGEGWLSGFALSPQLNWQFMAAGYATTQIQRRLIPVLQGDAEPELTITADGLHATGPLFCGAPKPRMHIVRQVGAVALQFAGSLTSPF